MTDEIKAAAEDETCQTWRNENMLMAEWTERAKSIDREWLESIGFRYGLHMELDSHFMLSTSSGEMCLHGECDELDCAIYRMPLPHITTRGQVLDLLRVLGKDVKP